MLRQRIKIVYDIWVSNGNQPSETDYKKEMIKIRIIDFHGEMIFIVNYSNVNYQGLAKILKKYKRTGGVLRLPFIQKVLEKPFFTTQLILKLVKDCESIMDTVFPAKEEIKRVKEAKEAIIVAGEGIFKNIVAASLTMQEIQNRELHDEPLFSASPQLAIF